MQDFQAVIITAGRQGEGDKYDFPDGNVFTFPTKFSLQYERFHSKARRWTSRYRVCTIFWKVLDFIQC